MSRDQVARVMYYIFFFGLLVSIYNMVVDYRNLMIYELCRELPEPMPEYYAFRRRIDWLYLVSMYHAFNCECHTIYESTFYFSTFMVIWFAFWPAYILNWMPIYYVINKSNSFILIKLMIIQDHILIDIIDISAWSYETSKLVYNWIVIFIELLYVFITEDLWYSIENILEIIFWPLSKINPILFVGLLYPAGLTIVLVFFLFAINWSHIRVFFIKENNENVLSLLSKFYKNSVFINILITYNLIFALATAYYLLFTKSFYSKYFNAVDNYIVKTITTDYFSAFSIFFIMLFFLIFLVISKDFIKNVVKFEFILLLIVSVFSLVIMIQLSDVFLVYVGIVILSLSLYPLIALDKNSAGQTEAAAKYFFMGGVANSIMLYGISLLYREFNSVNYFEIKQLIIENKLSTSGPVFIVIISMLFIMFGFFFKISLVPLQNWTPDVYLGAPTVVTCFLATVVKFGVYISFIRFYYGIFIDLFSQTFFLKNVVMIFALSSILVGAYGSIDQFKIKRFIGFTTINQMGFILLGVSLQNLYGFVSSYIYLCIYTVLNLIFFSFIINSSFGNPKRELVYLSDLIPFFKYNRLAAFTFIMLLFSLAGMPPTIGFYMKLLILKAMIISGHIKLTIFVLYINIISIFYYFRIIKLMFFDAEFLLFVNNEDRKMSESLTLSEKFDIVENDPHLFNFTLFKNKSKDLFTIAELLNDEKILISKLVKFFFYGLYYSIIWLFLSGWWLTLVNLGAISSILITFWNDLNLYDVDIIISSFEISQVEVFLKFF
jgi:NADH-quinone oxidoreductase subunit N